jgi:hypothetical protein
MKHSAKEREKQRAKERQRQIDSTAFNLLCGAMVVWGGVVIYWYLRA